MGLSKAKHYKDSTLELTKSIPRCKFYLSRMKLTQVQGNYKRNVAGAPETSWPDGAYVTRRGCFKDFNSAHFVYRFLIRRILFSSSRSAEMLFWEIYFIYTLEGKEISKTLNIGQEFMKKIYFANTQPMLMTFTLL